MNNEILFFDWAKIKDSCVSYKQMEYLLYKIYKKSPVLFLGKNLRFTKNFNGSNFLLNPKIFFNNKIKPIFKQEAVEVASIRNYSDFHLYGYVGVNPILTNLPPQRVRNNPLFDFKQNTIYIKTGNIWH